MVLMLGDLIYAGHSYMSTDQFIYAIHEVMKSDEMRELYTKTPVRYLLDDHDTGANNCNGLHKSLKQAVKGYE